MQDFDPSQWIDRKTLKRIDRFVQYALAASVLEVEDAGVSLSEEARAKAESMLERAQAGVDLQELGDSPRLGLAVVGRLCKAFDMQISLRASAYGGVRAVLVIPRVMVTSDEAPGLAECVESGTVDDEKTRLMVRRCLEPLHRSGADVLALGCTHYAFLRPLIEAELGEGICVIEPSQAVARQVQRVLDARKQRNPRREAGRVRYVTSGDPATFAAVIDRLRLKGAYAPDGTVTVTSTAPASEGMTVRHR